MRNQINMTVTSKVIYKYDEVEIEYIIYKYKLHDYVL